MKKTEKKQPAYQRPRWTDEEERFVRANAGSMEIGEMARRLGKTEIAVQLFIHRRQIPLGAKVRRNLVTEMLRLKFIHPENFRPTRLFYHTVGITPMRWYDIYFGRKAVTETEYLALARYFGVTLQEAFESCQLSLFETPAGGVSHDQR